MVKHGAIFTCERCGKKKFVAEREDGRGVGMRPAGWTAPDGRSDLCETCTDLYNKMMNEFFSPEVKRAVNLED